MEKKFKENVDQVIEILDRFSVVKKDTPCVILYRGKQIKLPSGKSAWKNLRAAKLAFSNAIHYCVNGVNGKEVREELERQGILEFKTFNVNEEE